MKTLEHFQTIVISVCLVICACDCTSIFDINNQDETDKKEIQDLKVQVNSLTSVVEHLLKDSESKENKVNSLTSVLQHFLEDSNLKETRITTLEKTVGELEKTINIQVELNSQDNKTK